MISNLIKLVIERRLFVVLRELMARSGREPWSIEIKSAGVNVVPLIWVNGANELNPHSDFFTQLFYAWPSNPVLDIVVTSKEGISISKTAVFDFGKSDAVTSTYDFLQEVEAEMSAAIKGAHDTAAVLGNTIQKAEQAKNEVQALIQFFKANQ
jgi:hypothetical protein